MGRGRGRMCGVWGACVSMGSMCVSVLQACLPGDMLTMLTATLSTLITLTTLTMLTALAPR